MISVRRPFVTVVALAVSAVFALACKGNAQSYTESVLYAPQAISDGINFFAPVIQASDGNLYGVATGNTSTGSTIFKLSLSGNSALVYNWLSNSDQTRIGLTEGSDASIDGVLTSGGTSTSIDNYGLIFSVSSSGGFSTLYTFCTTVTTNGNCIGPAFPDGVMIVGSDGNLYGTTVQGGATPNGAFDGTIFKITPSGILTILYSFCSQGGSACTDGRNPAAGLVQGIDGNFYGTTEQGGQNCPALNPLGTIPGCGTVFKITPQGVYTVIHTFTGAEDGAFPTSRLVQAADGNFYGTENYAPGQTYQPGGIPIPEAVYRITPAGVVTPVYTLSSGAGIEDGLYVGSDGNLYGTDYAGGDNGLGSIYRISLDGTASVLYSFSSSPDGSNPEAPPMQGSDGNFYGTTLYGGNLLDNGVYASGTVWKLAVSPPLSPPVALALSQQNIQPNQSVTLNWSVANAYSTTLQQCYAFIQGAPSGAGSWSGLQTGTFDATQNPPYSGSATITPTLDGSYTYALTCGGMETGFATLTVSPPASLMIDTSTLPTGVVGTAYTQTLQVSGGVPPYSYTLVSGSLPTPLQLNSNTGAITGTPTTPGAYNFSITVKDSESPAASVTAPISITVMGVTPSVSLSAQPNTGLAYGQAITLMATESPVEGLAQGYSWTISEDGGALVTGALSNGSGSYTMTTTPHAGQHTFTATYSSTQSLYPAGTSNTVTLTVGKATPTVSTWPMSSAITYGQTLASSTLSGGAGSTAGTFTWITPTTALGAGTTSQGVTFTPADTTDYNTVTGTVPVTVNKATPTVTAWPTASAIIVGQALSSSILSGGSASVPGTFAWMSPSTVPAAGSYSGSVTFAPTDGTDYNAVNGTVTVSVNAAPSFTLSPAPATLTIAQGGSETTTITVTDVGGFSGTVSLAASGLPTGVTASFAAGTSPGTQVLTLTAGSATLVTSSAVTITITGTSGSTTATTIISLNITPQPSFTAGSGGTTAISVTPGATTGNTGTISVVGTNGFSGTMNLTCAVTTSVMGVNDPPSCSLNPTSLTISGTAAQTSTLTVTTTAASSAKNQLQRLFGPLTGGTALAVITIFLVPRRRRNWFVTLGLFILFVSVSAIGCGGGGNGGGGGGGGNSGTTTGTYTITVTGTSNAISATVGTVTLTVQ